MPQTYQNAYVEEAFFTGEQSSEQAFAETPFLDSSARDQEQYEGEAAPVYSSENWEFTTPFLPGESYEAGESESLAPELASFSELSMELKDTLFREALEQLADETLEYHAEQLSAEYGDREARDASNGRMLYEHLMPLATQADSMLDRFFERLEGMEAEALTDIEIGRIASEVMPASAGMTPASEQFLGGLLRKAGHLVSGAVKLVKSGAQGALKLAGKGLSALGKLALGPLLAPLKLLGRFLLKHVVQFALGQLPPTLRPIAQTLATRLLRAVGEVQEAEGEELPAHEHDVAAAAVDAGHLEAEFDVRVAQLLHSDEQEMEHLVQSYGEGESVSSVLPALDNARTQLAGRLATMEQGENAQPVMEQFVPALLWPAAKTAITILGRPKLVKFLGNLLGGLIKPLVGASAGGMLAPAIADAGLRIFGLEAPQESPRAAVAEALAATIEETVNAVAGMPPHILENEALLSDAVHEAFESAASAYFPNSAIKPELRESAERHGRWARVPQSGGRKRYARYSDTLPVEISPRLADTVESFGRSTLRDHLQADPGLQKGGNYKAKVTLYQALPGSSGRSIARAEGFPISQLHPLTPQAAGALLGPSAALGLRPTPPTYLDSPNRLHLHQRLYRVHPGDTRQRRRRHSHSEVLINLQRGEIRLWLYLSEDLCQRLCGMLARGVHAGPPFTRVHALLRRTTHGIGVAALHHQLPPGVLVVSHTPNLAGRSPHWLRTIGHTLAHKINAWAQDELAHHFRRSAAHFRQVCSSSHDGVTLRLTMTQVPGMDALVALSQGRPKTDLARSWPPGAPHYQVTERPGYIINRLRD